MEKKLIPSITPFKTKSKGWMNLNLRPVDVSSKLSFEEWKEKYGKFSRKKKYNLAKQEKQYLTYLKKRRRNVKMSPGTAATVSIKCEKSFKSCKMKSNTKPFLMDMYKTAYAATDFMIHMIDSFETWCNQMGVEENELSFQKFGNIVEEDLPISKEINDGINKFSYNFTNLRTFQPWPDTPPNQYTVSLDNEFSNLSWSIP
jgi:hypothetical protein